MLWFVFEQFTDELVDVKVVHSYHVIIAEQCKNTHTSFFPTAAYIIVAGNLLSFPGRPPTT